MRPLQDLGELTFVLDRCLTIIPVDSADYQAKS